MEVTTVNSNVIVKNNWILKPNFHMNYGKKRIEKALRNKQNFSTLGEVADSVFTGGIFKRIFVDNPDYGFPYISAQHMMNANPLEVAKCISKKYTPKLEEMTLKENQILVSCAGTVGNIKLITKDLTEVVGSQDIIRIDADNSKMPYGYLYAYLSTKTAYNYIQSFIYGSVVPRIEPNTLSLLPVPLLPESKQQQIHQLIVDASALRVEANKLLKEAHNLYETKFNSNVIYSSISKINIKRILIEKRFSGNYFLSKGDFYEKEILKSKYNFLVNHCESIFTSGRDKRNYTSKERGIAFLSNGDISSSNPFNTCNYIVKSLVKEHSLIKHNMILTGRVGQDTVGKVYLPYDSIINSVASDNIIRIKINDDKIKNLVFAFLSSSVGKEIIRKRKTGVGQPFVSEEMFFNIPIPILEEKDEEIIFKKVNEYNILINDSLIKELLAIDLIEKEIDAWQ